MLNVANERIKENMLERSEAAASGGIDMDDDDDEDDDSKYDDSPTKPFTGDLMHHVSISSKISLRSRVS
jgi:hypothetical protein